MECPHCNSKALIKKGRYKIASSDRALQRYQCKACKKFVSESWWSPEYRLRKRKFTHELFHLLCRGLSQRACAKFFGVKREAIALRLELFGECASANLKHFRANKRPSDAIILDEMESFEHTKCKPLTIPLVVEDKSRLILSLRVGAIAAKGPLAEVSRLKYGLRVCQRKQVVADVIDDVKNCLKSSSIIKTDKSPHYCRPLKSVFPKNVIKTYKGRKARENGLGELKKGGFDPIFSLNHTAAMIRDNLKRMARKTWATTKKAANLELALFMYAWAHNLRILDPKSPLILEWISKSH